MSLQDHDFEALTFDCYGTLIDWEQGILDALAPLRGRSARKVTDEWLLRRFAIHESEAEKGPFRRYRDVLIGVGRTIAADLDIELRDGEEEVLPRSLARWPPFSDTRQSLDALASRWPLGILSNVDDDLFAASSALLGVEFRWVVTAQQVGSYKPAQRNFTALIERTGLRPDRILHIAQSRFHDIAPARDAGLCTVWVDRRAGREGSGATPDAAATPDLRVGGLGELCAALGVKP